MHATSSWKDVTPGGRLLRPAEVVRMTGLSRSQIYAMISEGSFPPFIKISERAAALPETWLEAFIGSCASRALDKHQTSQVAVSAGD
ncbi:MAG: AlpA family phage regulatory protein [Pseudomonadota bacterium]